MIDWNDLKYVLALRDGKTIKHAAELLKTNPTTVSRHIKKLSTQLGVTLFHLTRDGDWELSSKGQELCQIASGFKNNLDHVIGSKLSTDDEETYIVTSLEFLLTHYVSPKLGDAERRFPNLRLLLRGSDRRLSLAYGEADMALRFGRPTEGQLLASKIADIDFDVYHPPGRQPKRDWVGLQEELDWTPEMKLGFEAFGGPPKIRVSSFAAAREAAFATNSGTIGPRVVMEMAGKLQMSADTPGITREVWSVIHESRRSSENLLALRAWVKEAVQTVVKERRRAHPIPFAKTANWS